MKLVLMAVVITCLAGAAMAFWRQRLDAAFVIATIGLMAWFLRYRSDLKESLAADGSQPKAEPAADSEDENS